MHLGLLTCVRQGGGLVTQQSRTQVHTDSHITTRACAKARLHIAADLTVPRQHAAQSTLGYVYSTACSWDLICYVRQGCDLGIKKRSRQLHTDSHIMTTACAKARQHRAADLTFVSRQHAAQCTLCHTICTACNCCDTPVYTKARPWSHMGDNSSCTQTLIS